MPDVKDAEYLDMRRIFRACANQFRRYERGERAKVEGAPLSMVESQQALQAANMNKAFAEACEKYAATEGELVDTSLTVPPSAG